MASLLDLIGLGTDQQRAQDQAPAQSPGSDLAGQWRSWIGDPDNRAAMMQFGISLLQPMGYGQTPLGHVGAALGSAGEAVSRRRKEDIAQQEADTKAVLREAQAGAAESRAREAGGTAAARETAASAAAERARAATEMLGLREALGGQATAAKLQKEYLDAKVLFPNLTEDEFLKSYQRFLPAARGAGAAPATAPAAAPQYEQGKSYNLQLRNGQVRPFRYNGGDPAKAESWTPL